MSPNAGEKIGMMPFALVRKQRGIMPMAATKRDSVPQQLGAARYRDVAFASVVAFPFGRSRGSRNDTMPVAIAGSGPSRTAGGGAGFPAPGFPGACWTCFPDGPGTRRGTSSNGPLVFSSSSEGTCRSRSKISAAGQNPRPRRTRFASRRRPAGRTDTRY